MLFSLISRLLSSTLTHLYPAYLSYKLLSTRPTPLPLLESTLKYWCVLGTFTFFENTPLELLISWIPFYGILKLVILAYLVLPQTQGSTHVYDNLLQPWFEQHESSVDGALEEGRKTVYAFVQTKVRALWEALLNSTALGQVFPTSTTTPSSNQAAAPPVHPPTMSDPISGPTQQLAAGFWHAYGPSVLATGAALYRQFAPAAQPQSHMTGYDTTAATLSEDRPVSSRMSTSQSVIDRRRQLEAELAALNADESSIASGSSRIGSAGPPPPFPIPQIPIPSMFNPTASASSAASSSSSSTMSNSPHSLRERERTTSMAGPGGFEEIYSNELDEDDDGVGHDYPSRPGMPSSSSSTRRTSWFGWGGSGGGGAYERVKSE